MIDEDIPEAIDAQRQIGYAEAQVDHAGVWPSLAEHELTEVPVVRHQDALVAMGKGKHIFVVERTGVVLSNR